MVPTADMVVRMQNGIDTEAHAAIRDRLIEYVGQSNFYQSFSYWRVALCQHQISELRQMRGVSDVSPSLLGDVPYDPTDSWSEDHIYCGTGYPISTRSREIAPSKFRHKACSYVKDKGRFLVKGRDNNDRQFSWTQPKGRRKDSREFSWTQPKSPRNLDTCHSAAHHIKRMLPVMTPVSTNISRTTRHQSCRLLLLPVELRSLIFSSVIETADALVPPNLLEEDTVSSVFRHSTWLAIHQGHIQFLNSSGSGGTHGVEYKAMIAATSWLMRSCRMIYHELLHLVFAKSLELEPHTEAIYKFLSHASVEQRLAVRRLKLRFVIPLNGYWSGSSNYIIGYFSLRRPQVMKMLMHALARLEDVTCIIDTRGHAGSSSSYPIAYALAVVLLPLWNAVNLTFISGLAEYEETATLQQSIIRQAMMLLKSRDDSLIGASTDVPALLKVLRDAPTV